jgi:hypothetical protein
MGINTTMVLVMVHGSGRYLARCCFNFKKLGSVLSYVFDIFVCKQTYAYANHICTDRREQTLNTFILRFLLTFGGPKSETFL